MFTKKGDAAVLAKLSDAPAQYREIGERLHAIIRESAPTLEPIVRWGLPFYVKDGKDICYIKPDKDFIAFGFGEVVNPLARRAPACIRSRGPLPRWTTRRKPRFARSSRKRWSDNRLGASRSTCDQGGRGMVGVSQAGLKITDDRAEKARSEQPRPERTGRILTDRR
jgi:hypothetical protein